MDLWSNIYAFDQLSSCFCALLPRCHRHLRIWMGSLQKRRGRSSSHLSLYLNEKNFCTSKYEYNTTFFTYYAFFFCFFSCFNSLHNLIRVTFWCGWTIECLVPSLFFLMLSSFVFGGFLINLCSIFASSNKSFLIRNNNNKSLSRPMVWYLRAGFRICFCRTEPNQIVIYQFNSVRSKSKNLTGQEIESIGYVFDATQNRKLN